MFQRKQNTTLISSFLFYAKFFWKAAGNFAVLKNRNVRGRLISMHQSGTHYLKHMIACALAHKFGIPDPEFNHANDIFGGPKDPVVYHDIPRLISSHSNAHPALAFASTHKLFNLPPYVLLVRDIRGSLMSNYAKWSHHYNVPFSTYLRGDNSSKKFYSDIWWSIRFLYGWCWIRRRVPTNTLVVKYEELFKEPL